MGSDFTFYVPTPGQIAQAQRYVLSTGVTPNPALTKMLSFFPQPTGFKGSTGTVAGSVKDKNDVDSFIVKLDQMIGLREHSCRGATPTPAVNRCFPWVVLAPVPVPVCPILPNNPRRECRSFPSAFSRRLALKKSMRSASAIVAIALGLPRIRAKY